MAGVSIALLDLDATSPGGCDLLSPKERARAANYRNPRDSLRFVQRRAWLRRLLAAQTGARPEQLLFAINPYGKPHLSCHPELRFSLSHSAGMAMAVIGGTRSIGCDIEAVNRRNADPSIARAYFADPEQTALDCLSGQEWTNAFFRIWTRKEAVVKAVGTGLSLPLKSFSVGATACSSGLVVAAEARWFVSDVAAPAGCVAALAVAAD